MPNQGPPVAEIMIITDYPDNYGTGFGYIGAQLSKLGITSTSCFFTTLTEVSPPEGDIDNWLSGRKTCPGAGWVHHEGHWVSPPLWEGWLRVKTYLTEVQPKLVIAVGKAALLLLTGNDAIAKWRGSRLTPTNWPFTVVPVQHPRILIKQPDQDFILKLDLQRVYNVYTHRQLPRQYNFLIEPSYHQVTSCLLGLLERASAGPLKLSSDLETRAANIACHGIAWSPTEAICVPHLVVPPPRPEEANPSWTPKQLAKYKEESQGFWERYILHGFQFPEHCFYWTEEEESDIIALYAQLFHHPNITWIGQNYSYDCQYFWRHWGILPLNVRDTMIGHHSLHSNIRKGLDFLSSMYAQDHIYWKGEISEWNPLQGERQYWTYNCKDCCITYEIDEQIVNEARERV